MTGEEPRRDFDPPSIPGAEAARDDPPREPSPRGHHSHDRRHGPVRDELVTGEDLPHSHRRLWITAGAALVVVVLLVAALLVWGPGSPFRQSSDPSSPGSPVSSGPVEAPVLPDRFDNYVRQQGGATASQAPSEGDDLAAATAVYTVNGQPAILLVAARPVTEMAPFLLSLGATDPVRVADGWCSTYDDVSLCGVQRGDTAWVVSPLTDLTDDELLSIAARAAEA